MLEYIHHYDLVNLSSTKSSTIEVLKVGKVLDRNLEITSEMLDDFILNFEGKVYGTDVQVNLGHDREGEAAGWVTKLFRDGDVLFAEVEWTPLGIEKIQAKQYRFTSSELALEYPHATTGEKVKNVFTGVALTNVPAIKGMQPVTLSTNYLNFNKIEMEKTKKLFGELLEKTEVTNADLEALKKCAEEEGVEVGDMMAQLEEKNKKEAGAPNLSTDAKQESLTEKEMAIRLSELEKQHLAEKQENQKLREKIRLSELSEKVENNVALSENTQIGFNPQDSQEVVAFLSTLNDPQVETFLSLFKKIKYVDFSVKGSTKAGDATKDEAAKIEELNAKAKEIALKDNRDLSEVLSELIIEAGLGN